MFVVLFYTIINIFEINSSSKYALSLPNIYDYVIALYLSSA